MASLNRAGRIVSPSLDFAGGHKPPLDDRQGARYRSFAHVGHFISKVVFVPRAGLTMKAQADLIRRQPGLISLLGAARVPAFLAKSKSAFKA